MSARQLFRIAAWKSAKGLAPLTLNTEDQIAERTRSAIEVIKPWRSANLLHPDHDFEWPNWTATAASAIGSKQQGSGLLGLDGVGYPMATALLAFLAPGAFPVMDIWTIRAIYGAKTTRKYERAVAYTDFARQLVEVGSSLFPEEPDVHSIDIAVMNRSMACRHGNRPCPCFPDWPAPAPT